MQPNGQPRDMVARSLMLELHRAGQSNCRPSGLVPPNNAARHRPPASQSWRLEAPPLECSLAELGRLEIRQVRRTPEEKLFGSLHAGGTIIWLTPNRSGEHLKYLVCAQGQPIACLAWSSAPRHLGPPRPIHRLVGAAARGPTSICWLTTRGS